MEKVETITKEEVYREHFGVNASDTCEVCYGGNAKVSKIWVDNLVSVIDNIKNYIAICPYCKMKYHTPHYKRELQKLHNAKLDTLKNGY